ncbi:MAG: HET domain-containing protein [Sulfuricella sp.]
MHKSECTFRLLEPVTSFTLPDAPFIELSGKRWVLTEYAHLSDAPVYTCISYAWGERKTKNLLNDDRLMSARTIPVIEATINASQSQKNWADNVQFSHDRDPQKEEAGRAAALKASQAFWIDALCVPSQDPVRTACLRSMGEVYSSAWQVVVVLSKSCSDVFHQIRHTGRLDPTALFILESDDWITRAWAYQETVNSKALYFIVQDDESTLISGVDFLNAVVTATEDYKNSHGIDSLAWVKHHPRLDSLEMLIADYKIADYAARSAYQVMSVIDQRVAERTEDHFYAMIGAIKTMSLDIQDDESLHPSEYFMRVCEAKGDYSFIYNLAPRSEVPGRRWRPIEGKFPAVLSGLLVSGGGQAGTPEPTHLQLDNMCRLLPGTINPDGLKATRWFMRRNSDGLSPDGIASAILERLETLGFTGCGEYLELENGFFFPQSKPTRSDDIFVAISPDVQWTNGGPGLLLRSNGTDTYDFCDVGAFVGRVPKLGESINVG